MALTRGAQAMDIIALPDNKEVVLGIMSNICPLLGEFNTPLGAEGEILSVRTTYPVMAMPTLIVLCWFLSFMFVVNMLFSFVVVFFVFIFYPHLSVVPLSRE